MKLLLVDDDPLLLTILEIALLDAGYEVSVAMNGRDALLAVERERFDLMITDIGMPVMDGLTLIRTLRGSPRDLPILAISGGVHEGGRDALKEARSLGADATLAKPFIPDQLIRLIEDLRAP